MGSNGGGGGNRAGRIAGGAQPGGSGVPVMARRRMLTGFEAAGFPTVAITGTANSTTITAPVTQRGPGPDVLALVGREQVARFTRGPVSTARRETRNFNINTSPLHQSGYVYQMTYQHGGWQ